MRAYVDSDVLIWHLRGDAQATEFLRDLAGQQGIELWVGAMQRAEIVFFMRPSEGQATLSLLSRFQTEPVTQQVVDSAGALFRQYGKSHDMDANDALLAATVLETGGTLHTLNVKHYPVPGLPVNKPW